jgi:hypothetical protein
MDPLSRPLVWRDGYGRISYDSRIIIYLKNWMSEPEAYNFFIPFTPKHAERFGWIVYHQLYDMVDIVKEIQRYGDQSTQSV